MCDWNPTEDSARITEVPRKGLCVLCWLSGAERIHRGSERYVWTPTNGEAWPPYFYCESCSSHAESRGTLRLIVTWLQVLAGLDQVNNPLVTLPAEPNGIDLTYRANNGGEWTDSDDDEGWKDGAR